MTQPAIARLVTWAVVAVGLAGCAGSGGPVEAPQPTWQSGYAWTYSSQATYEFTEEEDGERYNETESYQWRLVTEVLNSTRSADGEPYYVVGGQFDGDQRGRMVQLVRARDLAELDFRSRHETRCMNEACTASFSIQDVNVSAPTFLDFPLERGKRWGGLLPYDEIEFVYQAEVDGAYRVDTGLGPMEAARITMTVRLADEAAARRAILAEGEEEGYRVDELRFSMFERMQVYYSDAYQAVVRVDVLDEESFVVRGTGPDGERFDYSGAETGRRTTVIEGARLLPRPERSLDEVGMFLNGDLDLRDPTGQQIVAADYRITVDPPTLTVNAGADEVANFTALIDGEKPDNHTLHWRLLAEDGSVASRGEGSTFAVDPARPGRYAVEVEAREGNASVAAAGASLTADWIVQKRVDCGPASVFTTCVSESLPVHPGARSLLVRVTPVDVVDGLSDVLWVTDSAGTRIDGQSGANGWTVHLEPVAGYLVDQDPWRAEFRRGVAALSQADVEVQVLYGSSSTPSGTVSQAERSEPSFLPLPWHDGPRAPMDGWSRHPAGLLHRAG